MATIKENEPYVGETGQVYRPEKDNDTDFKCNVCDCNISIDCLKAPCDNEYHFKAVKCV